MNREFTDNQGTRSAAYETETSNDGSFREFEFSTSPMSLERSSLQRRYKSSSGVGYATSHYPSVYDVQTASLTMSHDPWKQGERQVPHPHHLTMNNDSQRQRQQQSELEYQRQNEQRLNAQRWEREAELQRYHAQALLASRMDQLDLNDPGRRTKEGRSDYYEPDLKAPRTPDLKTQDFAYSRQRNQRHPNRYQCSQEQELKKPPPPPPTPTKRRAIEIEISPGVFAALHGSDVTMAAIERGAVVTTFCLLCECRLQCVDDCLCVLCPDCRVVSPVLLTDAGETPDKKERSGVGLGLKVQS